jgi:DNA repair protein SbcC/Rad50
MKFKSIRLNNIRSYIDQQIDFPDGSILLSGDIGSGKSTILLAMEFALFGVKRGDISATSLLRNGTDFGVVELNFEIQGKDVIINRSLKRTNTSVKQEAGYIIINGVRQDGTTTELKAKILELLGYPLNVLSKGKDLIYRFTVYTPQEEMKHILFEDTDARLDTLRKVFNIDKYKRIKENTLFTQRELRVKKRFLEKEAEQLPQFLEIKKIKTIELEQKNTLVQEMTEKLTQVETNIQDGKDKLKKLEDKITILQELKKNLALKEQKKEHLLLSKEKNQASIQIYEKQTSEMKEKLKTFPEIEEIKDNPNAIEKEIEENLQKIQKIKQEAFIIEQEQKYITQKQQDLQPAIEEKNRVIEKLKELQEKQTILANETQQITQLQEQKQSQENKTKELFVKLTELEANLTNANKTIEKMGDLDQCPLCLQEVHETHKNDIIQREKDQITQTQLTHNNLKTEHENLKKELEQTQTSLTSSQEKEKELKFIDLEIKNLLTHKTELENKEKTLTDLKNKLQDLEVRKQGIGIEKIDKIDKETEEKRVLLKKIHNYLEKKAEKANLLEKLQEKEDQIMKINNELENIDKENQLVNQDLLNLQEQHKEFADTETLVNSFKEKMQKLQEIEKSILLKKLGHQKEKETCESIIAEANNNIQEKERAKNKSKDIDNLNNWFDEYFLNLMNIMERCIMASLYHEFNSYFVSWFTLLIEDENVQVRLDDTFSPVVIQNGYETGLESLSGGEKTSVALSYRLALNKVINGFVGDLHTKDVIILDEPTDGFSSEQLDKIREVLEQLDMDQVIIVSHESKIESFVDHVIRISKTEHKSQIHD